MSSELTPGELDDVLLEESRQMLDDSCPMCKPQKSFFQWLLELLFGAGL